MESRKLYCKPREEVEDLLKRWDEGSTGPAKDVNEVIKQEEDFEMPLI